MSDLNSSVPAEVVKSIDEVREHLTPQEKMLIDSFLQAHLTMQNAVQFLKLDKPSLAEMVCDTGKEQRLAYLMDFLESKKVKAT